MTEFKSVPFSVRSSHGFNWQINVPYELPLPLIRPIPVIMVRELIVGSAASMESICSNTFPVCSKEVPGAMDISIMITPLSSFGTSPVGVIFIRPNMIPPKRATTTRLMYLCFISLSTDERYLFVVASKAVLNAL